MKKTYESPVVEMIEFDYEETVVASGHGAGGKQTYMVSNENYDCHSSLMPDYQCGLDLSGGKQVSNATYDCGN